MIAAEDRLDDDGVAERLDIALALQPCFVGIDAARDVDRQNQREVDFLALLRSRRQGQEEKGDQTNQSGHGDLRVRLRLRGKNHTARRKPVSAAHWTGHGVGR